MKEKSHKKFKKQKVYTYLSVQDVKRLELICKKYKYNSIYQLLQYLAYCFLRVADPENDPILEPVSDEIREIFISPREYKRLKKNISPDIEIQLLIPFSEYRANKVKKVIVNKDKMKLIEEITELFTDNAEWEKGSYSAGSHKDMIVKKRPDQRKIQTANDIK